MSIREKTTNKPQEPAGCELSASAGSDFGEEFWCRNNFTEASCPFCGTKGLEVGYSSYGTDLYCADGCHGRYVFPCAPFEAWEMWQRNNPNTEVCHGANNQKGNDNE